MKTRLYTLVLISSILNFLSLSAQSTELPPIQLDRPDQTECPFITPKGYIQMEHGLLVENSKGGVRASSLPTSLWKYGINEKCELRLITEYNTIKEGETKISGLAPVTVGFKALLIEEDSWIPQTAFIGHLTTAKIGSTALRSPNTAPAFRFLMQHTITDKVSLSYNLGAEWYGSDARETYIYTLSTGIALSDRLGYFAELYGYIPRGERIDQRGDTGLTYLINNDLMADISASFGLANTIHKNYFSVGLSYRFQVRNSQSE